MSYWMGVGEFLATNGVCLLIVGNIFRSKFNLYVPAKYLCCSGGFADSLSVFRIVNKTSTEASLASVIDQLYSTNS
jgi:hypothetical protein